MGNGQDNSVLGGLMVSSSSQNIRHAESQLYGLVQQLKNKKGKSEIAFLKRVFNQTQKTFLSRYDSYSEFSELFTSGKYDCLTATSLYSIVLNQLNFKYSIIETNYHIFLLVNTSKGEVLLETTDRLNGFVRSTNEIRERIGTYRQSATHRSHDNAKIYYYHFDLYHEVSQNQLPGLLYFNQAVKAYNAGTFEKCAEFLSKAQSVYDTPRITEFSSIFLESVAASKLDGATKQRIADQVKNLRPAVLASR